MSERIHLGLRVSTSISLMFLSLTAFEDLLTSAAAATGVNLLLGGPEQPNKTWLLRRTRVKLKDCLYSKVH